MSTNTKFRVRVYMNFERLFDGLLNGGALTLSGTADMTEETEQKAILTRYGLGHRVRIVPIDKTGMVTGVMVEMGGVTNYKVRTWDDENVREIWVYPGELEGV